MKTIYRILAIALWLVLAPVPLAHLGAWIKALILPIGVPNYDADFVSVEVVYGVFVLIGICIFILPVWEKRRP